jgi:hypothetical protein
MDERNKSVHDPWRLDKLVERRFRAVPVTCGARHAVRGSSASLIAITSAWHPSCYIGGIRDSLPGDVGLPASKSHAAAMRWKRMSIVVRLRHVSIVLGLSAALLCVVAPRNAAAQAAPAPPASPAPAPSTEIGGLVDTYYDFYSTKPEGNAPYRNFDTKHNQFALSMAEAWLSKTPTSDSPIGFKLKLSFGPALSEYIHAAEPGATSLQDIQEAYVSYLAGKTQFDGGIFVTPAGAEVIEAKDNYNYSRSLLFALAIPYYHSGVRLTYSPSDKLTLMGGLVNGWNNVVENNTGKTVLASVTIKPTTALSFVENYIVGPETPKNATWRNLSDTVLTYNATSKLSLMANYDYGKDDSSHWQGIAAYLKYQASKAVAFSPRFEYYDDPQGFTTGAAQKLKEFTATLELKAADNLMWRIEYRGDFSDVSVFTDDTGGTHTRQNSIGFGLLYSFTGKIQ